MAKVKASGEVASIAGTIGGGTYRTTRDGLILAERASGRQGNTDEARNRACLMAQDSAAWARLDAVNREQWEAFGKQNNMSGRRAFFLSREWRRLNRTNTEMPVILSGYAATSMRGIAWCPLFSRFVACAQTSGRECAESGDGQHWTFYDVPGYNLWQAVCEHTNYARVFMVGAGPTYRAAFTEDFQTWHTTNDVPQNQWRRLRYSPDTHAMAAISWYGEVRCMITYGGNNWLPKPLPSPLSPEDICWIARDEAWWFVEWGAENNIMRTRNFEDFEWSEAWGGSKWRAMADAPELGITCIVGEALPYTSAISANFEDWTLSSNLPVGWWRSLVWCSSIRLFMASEIGGAYRYATSPDGLNWTLLPHAAPAPVYDLTWSNYHCTAAAALYDATRLAQLSSIQLAPRTAAGIPLALDYDESEYGGPGPQMSWRMARPAAHDWTWTRYGAAGAYTLRATIPAQDSGVWPESLIQSPSGASETWLHVWFGQPMNPGQEVYTGTYTYGGCVFWSRGPWQTDAIPWPLLTPLQIGSRVPVKLRFSSRGERSGPVGNFVATIT